jgi:putative transposase
VAPSGYYARLKEPLSNDASEGARLLRLIRASFIASQGIRGAAVFLDLREAEETCSKHRVARLMRENRLRALDGYCTRRWSVKKPAVLMPNLLNRQFTVTRPHTAWVTDITSIRMWRGWLYLGVVLDLFSRKDRRLVRRPDRPPRTRARCRADGRAPTTVARDADSLGSGHRVRLRCVAALLSFLSSRAEDERNAATAGTVVAESFFGSSKEERIKKQTYKTRELALTDVADHTATFYNRSRRYSHLGGVSPEKFEAAHKRRKWRVR